MKKLMHDIENFYKKFGFEPAQSPILTDELFMLMRLRFLQEELDEIRTALSEDSDDDFLDGIVDLMVVAMGTAYVAGLFPVLEEAWDRVMAANMLKEKGQGKRGHPMDLVKPAGWKAPVMMDLIDRLYARKERP
jgi:predicted HAD superfamily Cof-like phosphohydrolase